MNSAVTQNALDSRFLKKYLDRFEEVPAVPSCYGTLDHLTERAGQAMQRQFSTTEHHGEAQ